MQMWTCFDSEFIMNTLDEVLARNDTLTIWQTISGNDREKLEARLLKVEKNELTIELAPGETTQFSASHPLYIHCSYQDIVFKCHRFNKDGRAISFKFPNEIKMKDKRKVLRLPYRYQDSKIIAFHTPHKTNPNLPNVKMSSIMVDITTEGLSFVLPEREKKTLPVGTELFITRLTDQVLPNEHLAKVLYIVPYKSRTRGGEQKTDLIRIGAKFLEPLNSISYKSITSLIAKKQTRVKGLDVNSFNGLTDDEQVRVLRKIAEQNTVLANNLRDKIDQLDRLRYLTTAMKQQFLMDVNKDLLAVALRLSSKELIYDLLIDVTDTMREEFLYKLDQPKSATAVNKAQIDICKVISQKEKAGELILDPTAFEQYV